MATLKKYTLEKNEQKETWDLRADGSHALIKSFGTKAKATSGGALKRAVGGEGSVKIQKQNGRFQEERTYPRSKDPKASRG